MIESGAAIIAACLPTLKFLFAQPTIGKFSRSIRSLLSLHSHNSRFWPSRSTNRGDQTSPGSSVTHIARVEGVAIVESHAMKDVEASEAMRPQNGGIGLHKTLHQEESYI